MKAEKNKISEKSMTKNDKNRKEKKGKMKQRKKMKKEKMKNEKMKNEKQRKFSTFPKSPLRYQVEDRSVTPPPSPLPPRLPTRVG